MNQKYLAGCFTLIVVAIGLIVLSGAAYTVNMREQVVITQFGDPKGDPITEAGLKWKVPFIQKVNKFDKRILPWERKSVGNADQGKDSNHGRYLRAVANIRPSQIFSEAER